MWWSNSVLTFALALGDQPHHLCEKHYNDPGHIAMEPVALITPPSRSTNIRIEQRVVPKSAPAPSQALTVRETPIVLQHQALNRTAQGMEGFLAARGTPRP